MHAKKMQHGVSSSLSGQNWGGPPCTETLSNTSQRDKQLAPDGAKASICTCHPISHGDLSLANGIQAHLGLPPKGQWKLPPSQAAPVLNPSILILPCLFSFNFALLLLPCDWERSATNCLLANPWPYRIIIVAFDSSLHEHICDMCMHKLYLTIAYINKWID